MKTVLIRLIHGVWYFFATAVITTAVLVSVAHLMTPLLNKHRADIESWTENLLHVPISISEVRADWRGNVPEISLTEVVMLDKQTRKPAFEIQEIKIGLQLFSSLWQRKLVLQDIIISGAQVTVVQNAAGNFFIQDVPEQNEPEHKAYDLMETLAWAVSQSYFSFHDIDVHFIPFKGDKRYLTFNRITLSNGEEGHRVRCNFLLHQDIPTEIKADIEWTGNITDLAQIKARAHFNLEGFSLAQWLKERTFSGWQIHQGVGGADIWFAWENQQLQQVQSIFQWYDLEFYSEFDKKVYPIQRMSGHVGWKRDGEQQIFAGDDLLIDFSHHLWPVNTFSMTLSPRLNNKQLQLKNLRIGYVDIQDALPVLLANSMIPQKWRKNLMDGHIHGEIENIALTSQGDLTDIQQMTLSGEGKKLAFDAWRKLPGITNLSGNIRWDGRTGYLQLASELLTLKLDSLFAVPLTFNTLTGNIVMQVDKEGDWSFKSKNIAMANEDLSVKAALEMILSAHSASTIDLNGNFAITNIAHLKNYLPTALMEPELVEWVSGAFISGHINAGNVQIRGKLNNIPDELFEIGGNLENVDFAYAPEWPIMRQVNGNIIFSGRAMKVVVNTASLLNVPVKHVIGIIPYLGVDKPQTVEVKGTFQTDLARGLEFIHQSPLERTLGKDLTGMNLSGTTILDLSLSVPVRKPDETKILARAQVSRGVLALPAWNITLDQIHGGFQFTEKEVSAKQLQGALWGEPTTLQLTTVSGSGGPAYVQANIAGKIDIANLQDSFDMPLLQILSGVSDYQARLKLYKSGAANNEILLASNLLGIAVDLPQPIGKTTEEKRNFSLNTRLLPGAYLSKLKYGDLIQAQLQVTSGKDFRSIDIDSSQVKGRVRVAYPFDIKQPVQAQFDLLALASGNEKTISSIDPHAIPPLNITSRQFIYKNKYIGQLTLNTVSRANGMTIQNLNLSAADYRFHSHGSWVVANNAQQSQLQGTLESNQVNKFLDRLGLHVGGLIADKGQAAFELHWKGPPYNFSLAGMTGDFSFALEKGRIINLDQSNNKKMDIGRMLSLFSLQTIPRRLSLDFSDLFEQGYSFDFMRGDFKLRQGNAYTQRDAVFDGPVAHVTAAGRIGLLAQDYDLTLSVSPYVTESLPIVAGAITLNPLVGAAAWLVNKVVLSKEVSKAVTYSYVVTGPWSNPVWRSVEKSRRKS